MLSYSNNVIKVHINLVIRRKKLGYKEVSNPKDAKN